MEVKEHAESGQEQKTTNRFFEYQLQCRSGDMQFRILKREGIDHVEYAITIKDTHQETEETYTLDLNQFGDLKRLIDTLSKLEPQTQAERQRARAPGRENVFNEFF
jgi:hypothetical protein